MAEMRERIGNPFLYWTDDGTEICVLAGRFVEDVDADGVEAAREIHHLGAVAELAAILRALAEDRVRHLRGHVAQEPALQDPYELVLIGKAGQAGETAAAGSLVIGFVPVLERGRFEQEGAIKRIAAERRVDRLIDEFRCRRLLSEHQDTRQGDSGM